ncbi:protein PLASTID REDOX INSENSITIVE 2, chloroplastic-like isoform X2 [Rhodamnia argentea]|uniref:Protein PLASTID REDOX INSENSITIVE 2, chloroplastic-like isoform X2 n=1 Tax=Rhodamnia argentea TaxID=178133 RepID=A0ABM3HLC9_9MYRT|nr:protein PLASTID REDOX INSENSITIVE 2, chloroplastic-like isoform X2 [Rhodamnia argentea]
MRLTWRSHGFFAVSRQALFVRKPRNSPSWVRATSPQKHVYHDPIPELAASERRKFERDPREKLSGDIDTLGEDLDSVIKVCTQCLRDQIFSEFLREECGGPGALLVDPFTDKLVALEENNFPGATLAARASLSWAQNFVYQDWNTRGSS